MVSSLPHLSAEAQTAGLFDNLRTALADINAREAAIAAREVAVEKQVKEVQQLQRETDKRFIVILKKEEAVKQRDSSLPIGESAVAARERSIALREATLATIEERGRRFEEQVLALATELDDCRRSYLKQAGEVDESQRTLSVVNEDVARWKTRHAAAVDHLGDLGNKNEQSQVLLWKLEQSIAVLAHMAQGIDVQNQDFQYRVKSQEGNVAANIGVIQQGLTVNKDVATENKDLKDQLDIAQSEHQKEANNKDIEIKKLQCGLQFKEADASSRSAIIEELQQANKKLQHELTATVQRLSEEVSAYQGKLFERDLEVGDFRVAQEATITKAKEDATSIRGLEEQVRMLKLESEALQGQLLRAKEDLAVADDARDAAKVSHDTSVMELQDQVEELTLASEQQARKAVVDAKTIERIELDKAALQEEHALCEQRLAQQSCTAQGEENTTDTSELYGTIEAQERKIQELTFALEVKKLKATTGTANAKALKKEKNRLENELAASKNTLRRALMVPNELVSKNSDVRVRALNGLFADMKSEMAAMMEEKQVPDEELE